MKKRIIAVLCILALTVGILTVASAEGTEKEPLQIEVGYAKVDINPYWSIYQGTKPEDVQDDEMMPLLLTGTEVRLTAKTLVDDNGDGETDENDGLQATCIAIRKGGKTILLISADLYNCYSELVDGKDESGSLDDGSEPTEGEDNPDEEAGDDQQGGITTQNETGDDTTDEGTGDDTTNEGTGDGGEGVTPSKAGIRTKITEQLGIPAKQVMVTATNTNGAVHMRPPVDLDKLDYQRQNDTNKYTGTQLKAYHDAYFAHVTEKIAEAAEAAVADLTATTAVKKGSVDVSEELEQLTGQALNMNVVNHYKKTDENGLSFVSTPNSNDTAPYEGEVVSVSEADDMLHLISFEFESKPDIVLVNWRADAALNYSQARRNVTSDYINALRYSLEQHTTDGETPAQARRAAFSLGASANVSAVDVRTEQQKTDGDLAGVVYGQTLASAAESLLAKEDIMQVVSEGNIYTSQLSKYREPIQIPSDTEIDAAKAHDAAARLGSLTYPWQYKVANDQGEEQTLYIIASEAHANSIQRRAGYKELYGDNVSRKVELNAILIGNELAFVTIPFEAADRYSMEATLDNTEDNDWNDLLTYTNKAGVTSDNPYGTPFVLSCANDYIGHVPNNLAYTYNIAQDPVTGKDIYVEAGYAAGSNESQTAPVEAGSGETTVAKLDAMLESMTPVIQAPCTCCSSEENVDWLPLTEVTLEGFENAIPTGHYYLKDNMTYDLAQPYITNGQTVCLNLNGYTYSVNREEYASRAVSLWSQSTLNIWDTNISERGDYTPTGTMMGRGVKRTTETSKEFAGGTMIVNAGATVNLYSGTLTQEQVAVPQGEPDYGAKVGGVLYVQGTFNMYGGQVTGGRALVDDSGKGGNGGNIYITKSSKSETGGEVNLYGGQITGGYAQLYGGNVQITNGTLNLYDGTVNGGSVGKNGAGIDVCVSQSSGKMVMNGTDNETLKVGTVYVVVADQVKDQVVLSGKGTITKMGFSKLPAGSLVIDGEYTGKVLLNFNGSTKPAFGTDIGQVKNDADISGASITLTYKNEALSRLKATTHGTDLLVTGDNAAVINDVNGTELTSYDTLKEAVDAFTTTENASYIRVYIDYPTLELQPQVTEYPLTVDTYLDLNGCDVGKKGTELTFSGSTLYCMDSQTDDYTVSDGNYGKLNAAGNIEAVPAGTVGLFEQVVGYDNTFTQSAYMKFTEEAGVSFHRVYMEISSVVLRASADPNEMGIYYMSYFAGDEKVVESVDTFGVALTVRDLENDQQWRQALATSMKQGEGDKYVCLYSTYDQSNEDHKLVAGEEGKAKIRTSTLLKNIMGTSVGPMTNQYYASMNIYARSYLKTNEAQGEQLLFGDSQRAQNTLQRVTEYVDRELWTNLEEAKKQAVLEMYGTFSKVMNNWTIPNIKQAAKDAANSNQ